MKKQIITSCLLTRFKDLIGLACLDISTGTFRVSESADQYAVVDEIRRDCSQRSHLTRIGAK